jgi:NitT/TauT family transport system ATP-binding protein
MRVTQSTLVEAEAQTPAPVIRVTGVDKYFLGRTGAVQALAPVDLTVSDGEFVCLVGPSGCGKSTLLRIIGGLEEATSGRVELGVSRRAEAAFVFQEFGLFPWLTVSQNAQFGLRMNGLPRREREARASDWLGRVGLGAFHDAYPAELSGGMRQRLSIARAFATGPDVLLMDEPMGALDAQTRSLLQEDLLRLWETERKTVILVTHSLEEAILLGDRIVLMGRRPGHIKREFTVDLPRPRDEDIVASPEFGRLRAAIWHELREEVQASLEDGR